MEGWYIVQKNAANAVLSSAIVGGRFLGRLPSGSRAKGDRGRGAANHAGGRGTIRVCKKVHRTCSATSLWPLLRWAKLFPLGTTGGQDTRSTAANEISIELCTGIQLFPSARSDNWSDSLSVTSSFRDQSDRQIAGRYLHRRIVKEGINNKKHAYL
jgi:hypothetical protein